MNMIMIEKAEFEELRQAIFSMQKAMNEIRRSVNPDGKLYNIKETAKELGISRQTLHSHIRYGVVEPIILGNRHYFTRELIESIKTK